MQLHLGDHVVNGPTNVTVSVKTVLTGKTDLKYSSCCGSVVLDFSHARFTVALTRVVI